MKTIFDHIERVKSQPHHVRKRVAFGTAGVCTAIIALVWLASSVGTGAFALKNTSFADSAGQGNILATEGSSNTGAVAGASAGLDTNKDMPARIEIIDTVSSTSQSKKAEQTTIPF